MTMAPLVVKDKVLVGVGGGEYGIRGFIAAYDAKTGDEVWRFYTIPGPGEPGHETWRGDDWKTGGGSIWVTPSYDPELNLTYWGVGNPGPDWNPDQRPGDNLYTDSVVALDADTGELKWHFQFTPNDGYDYDAVQIAVLADINWRGTPTKAMLWANRNGIFYVLDRTNGKFLQGTPFVKVNWTSGLDANGRPIPDAAAAGFADVARQPGRHQLVFAVVQPAHRAVLRLGVGRLRVDLPQGTADVRARPARSAAAARARSRPVPGAPGVRIGRTTPINNWTDAVGHGDGDGARSAAPASRSGSSSSSTSPTAAS